MSFRHDPVESIYDAQVPEDGELDFVAGWLTFILPGAPEKQEKSCVERLRERAPTV